MRVGNWLTAEEGKKFLGAETAYTLRSRRNRALLSLLIGCGLRRAEVTTLRLEDLQLWEGHWVIADLRGKGGHIRTIPVPQWVKEAVDSWTVGAGITSGPLLRSINKAEFRTALQKRRRDRTCRLRSCSLESQSLRRRIAYLAGAPVWIRTFRESAILLLIAR